VHLLCVASLTPRKGHDILFRALAQIPHRRWRLTCVGSLERNPDMTISLRALARALGLENEIVFAGEAGPATLPAYYDAADVFVLPTLHEGYGMVVAEALARGLPIVSTDTGGIAELVGENAGLIVPPGDARAFSDALTRVVGDAPEAVALRRQLAVVAREVRGTLPTWDDAAERMDGVLTRVAG